MEWYILVLNLEETQRRIFTTDHFGKLTEEFDALFKRRNIVYEALYPRRLGTHVVRV